MIHMEKKMNKLKPGQYIDKKTHNKHAIKYCI